MAHEVNLFGIDLRRIAEEFAHDFRHFGDAAEGIDVEIDGSGGPLDSDHVGVVLFKVGVFDFGHSVVRDIAKPSVHQEDGFFFGDDVLRVGGINEQALLQGFVEVPEFDVGFGPRLFGALDVVALRDVCEDVRRFVD